MLTEYIHGYPFYTFQAPDILVDRILEKMKQEVTFKPITSTNKSPSLYGYVYKENYFTCFYDEELYNWLYECVNPVYETHFENSTKCKIVDLWATKTNFTESGDYHAHGLSVFSGLLYLQDSTAYTSFTFDDKFEQQWNRFTKIKTQQIEWKSESKKGKLLIWPSFIRHRISINREKCERYSIAFNTFWDGTASEISTGLLNLNTTQANAQKILTDYRK